MAAEWTLVSQPVGAQTWACWRSSYPLTLSLLTAFERPNFTVTVARQYRTSEGPTVTVTVAWQCFTLEGPDFMVTVAWLSCQSHLVDVYLTTVQCGVHVEVLAERGLKLMVIKTPQVDLTPLSQLFSPVMKTKPALQPNLLLHQDQVPDPPSKHQTCFRGWSFLLRVQQSAGRRVGRQEEAQRTSLPRLVPGIFIKGIDLATCVGFTELWAQQVQVLVSLDDTLQWSKG